MEAEALAQWAASDLRDPRDQMRLVLRQELHRRGLLRPKADEIHDKEGLDNRRTAGLNRS